MLLNREFLISYAQEFVSFLIRNIDRKLLEEVKLILLFGSAARGDATKRSDIDLFFDVASEDKDIEKALEHIIEAFYPSAEKTWHQSKGPFTLSLKVGRLIEWKDLHPSIITDGIILYGKYKPELTEGKHCVIFTWESRSLSESKRILLNRNLYGYNRLGKKYSGLLEKYGGEKLSPGSILFPLEHLRSLEEFFRKYHVAVKIRQITVL